MELTVVSYYRQQYFQLLDWVTACWCDWIKGNNDIPIYSNFEELILGKILAPNEAQDNEVVSSDNPSVLAVESKLDISQFRLE